VSGAEGAIVAVVFDWGDKVMRVFPEYAGPMADWPQVEVVEGAAAALAALLPRYTLVLATNAADSGAPLVCRALARAGLEGYFRTVLTARELGAHKPDPAFHAAVLRRLGCPPGAAVMVGDDYAADVAGARHAGLRAIWFNPAAFPCPADVPLHDAEVRSMAELPAALDRLPSPG
jgi:FMN phosphatase YigB (HAD superfamily)